MLAITNAQIFRPDPDPTNSTLLIENGRITQLAPTGDTTIPTSAERIDATGLFLVPGFIDLQLNGAFGRDFTTEPAGIWHVAGLLPRFGVTSFLPTIITSPLAAVNRARQVLRSERPTKFHGAEPLGLHLEGPFLNPRKKGAHNPAYLQPPDPSLIEDWSPAQGIRLVTLAPELRGALPLIETLVSRGVVVSAGHSEATLEQAQAATAAGLSYGTHLFNAMPPLHHRRPGLAAALLNTPGLVAGLIADGIHVHPALVKLIWSLQGPAGLNLVSDAISALGMPPGIYPLHDYAVTVTAQDCRLSDGTLAGSILPLDQALRNLITFTGASLAAALPTITTTPARLLGIEHERGRIAPGHIADLLLLTPDLHVHTTITRGAITHHL